MKRVALRYLVVLALVGAAAAQELTELRPADMGAYANFGLSLAAQGDHALVGAPGENALGKESGAVHVLRLAFGAWGEEQRLVGADGAGGDRFGQSVAVDGDRALIGAPGHGSGTGAAYVFRQDAGVWTQEAMLVAEDTNHLGQNVALLGDTALVVGVGPTETVHVFRRDGASWLEEAELVTPAPAGLSTSVALAQETAFVTQAGPFDPFAVYVFARDDHDTSSVHDDSWSLLAQLPLSGTGLPVALPLAAVGERMVVGRPLVFGSLSSAVFVFERDDGGTPGEPLDDHWIQAAEIVSPTLGHPGFGSDVALDGDHLLVCGPGPVPSGYVFRFDGGTWQLEALVDDPDSVGDMGHAGALAPGYAFLSDGSFDLGPSTGCVRVLREQGDDWTWKAKMLPEGLIKVGCFGCAVDVAGGPTGALLVGAQLAETAGGKAGAAYVFRRQSGGWVQESQLLPSGLAAGDRFGSSVAVDGERALVGAHQRDGAFADQGAAYVFRRESGAWIQEAELVAPEPSAFAYFGSAVALAGDVALVAAHADDGAGSDAGAVYVFRSDGKTWGLEAVLRALDATPGALFGRAVALEQGRALIGAPGAGSSQGAAYVFSAVGGTWVQESRLDAADGAPSDRFGHSCALSGNTALVGAFRADVAAPDMGAAYTFVRDPTGGAWSQEQKIFTTSSAAQQNDWYGASVSLDGDNALIGAPNGAPFFTALTGKAYRLARTPQVGSPWVETVELSDAVSPVPYQKGGFAVALDVDTFVVGAPVALYGMDDWDFAGAAFVGVVAPPLTAFPAALPALDGGVQALKLDAPVAHAGRTYLVLGSLSGTQPGLALGPWTLPLNPDAYFYLVLKEPGQPPASAFLGVLDVAGDAEASVLVPAVAALAGTTAHHAFAVLDFSQGAVTFVSNPAPLALTE